MKIFISYSRVDIEPAEKLYYDLKKLGFDPWMDKEDLLGGQDWKRTIRREIERSTFFLALISKSSLSKRGYVQKELRQALDILEEFPVDRTFVIPMRLDECSPLDERLKGLHRIDLFPEYGTGIKRLLKAMPSRSPSEKNSPRKCFDKIQLGQLALTIAYFLICGLGPTVYVRYAFPNGDVYVQLYSHFFLYPLYFGWIAVFLAAKSWRFLWTRLDRLQRSTLLIGIGVLVVVGMAIDMGSQNIAPFRLKPEVTSNSPILSRHFTTKSNNLEKIEYQNISQHELSIAKWSTSNLMYHASFYLQSYSLGVALTAGLMLVTLGMRARFYSLHDFRSALASSSISLLTFSLWLLMRVSFKQQKELYFTDESLPGADYVIAVGYIFCTFLVVIYYITRFGGKTIATLVALLSVLATVTIWKKPNVLVQVFGRDAGQASYMSILLAISFFGFVHWLSEKAQYEE